MYDLLLADAHIATESGIFRGSVAVLHGKVAAWLEPQERPAAQKTIDCGGRYVLPGFVDMHFHCRVPGRSDREDFDTATMCAAKGGITSLMEMPIAKPSPHDAETFRARVEYARDKAVIDYGFYAAGAGGDPERSAELARAGAVGFKLFLHAAPQGREDEFCDLCAADTKNLYRALHANAATGLITCVHAEDDGIIRARTEEYGRGDKNGFRQQFRTRIPEAEEMAILTAGLTAKAAGARLHICHISSGNGIRALEYLKAQGIEATGESCPPYLWMEGDILRKFGAYAKVNPPIRGGKHKVILNGALLNGTLDVISSDHAPFLPEEKEADDFLYAPAGMPSAEFFGPSILDRVVCGKLRMQDAVRLASSAPARLLGLSGKGTLVPGADADMILFDPQGETRGRIEESFSKSSGSLYPFHDRKYAGRIDAVFVRGSKVYQPNEILQSPGYGRFLPGICYDPKSTL